ncbi:hypothetical protein [Burkholderia stagnalis]|uniref:hypothetical protein n=1 Tax=Burkholderia stagnalis TaxID=1503054 RepID=UPI0012D8FB83|nr:hypothetical protein [Burkholderia stagnalis]
MLDITGTYDVHDGTSNFRGLDIGSVDAGSGMLKDSIMRDGAFDAHPITGRFDAATNSITFRVELFPGESLFATTFTGCVIPDPSSLGGVVGLSGTWSLLTITVGAPIDGKLPAPKLESETGCWFADEHQIRI